MYSVDDLRTLMQYLRDPDNGCPWDLKQSYQTIAPHTIEECFELIDAIEANDLAQMKQELGDVLFQVIFYCQLAEERADFSFAEVVDGIVSKLLRRHPHVFPRGTLERPGASERLTETEIKARWESIKAEERAQKSQHAILDDIPSALPAISRAQKLQKRAASVGFDWESADAVLEKLAEELDEFHEARARQDREAMADELGDVLFTLVNISRHLGFDAESLMRAASNKFESRFRSMESLAQGRFEALNSEEKNLLWEQAKAIPR